jgi:hypothetical protein
MNSSLEPAGSLAAECRILDNLRTARLSFGALSSRVLDKPAAGAGSSLTVLISPYGPVSLGCSSLVTEYYLLSTLYRRGKPAKKRSFLRIDDRIDPLTVDGVPWRLAPAEELSVRRSPQGSP